MNKPADHVDTPPTHTGPAGHAWRLSEESLVGPGKAGVDLWLVTIPGAHPVWSSYMLSACHLRSMPGVDDPKIVVPDSTHEMIVAALDPSQSRQSQIDNAQFYPLTPMNFVAQMRCASDEAMRAIVNFAVIEMVNGGLNPDTDYRGQWIERFGDGMMK